jgi:site-specific recombinase XerD
VLSPDGEHSPREALTAPIHAHQLRHAHAVELAHEGVPLVVIQRQLGHSNLGIASVYLQGIDNSEIIETVHARQAPMVPVHLRLGR